MATATIDRINDLSGKRSRLYSAAGSGRATKSGVLQRIGALTSELDELWELRRAERAGRREGVDLLIERSYQQLYGRNVDDVISPPSVADAEHQKVPLAA